MASPDEINFSDRANLIIGLKVPYRYRYLITPDLVAHGAELLRRGQTFEVRIDEHRVGAGFDAVTREGICELPGVTASGISAKGLITLIPKTTGGEIAT